MRTPRRRDLSVWTWRDLLEDGRTSRGISAAVTAGSLISCGLGWYAEEATPQDVVTALQRGHRLTCVSSLRHHGLWVPLVPGVHDAGRRSAKASIPDGGSCRSTAWLRSWPDDEPILPLRESLLSASRCLDVENLAIILESALNLRAVDPDDLDELMASFPAMTRRGLRQIESSAQSGTETRVRRLFESMGVTVRAQHRLEGVGILDMLVGELLVVECDSRQHHTGEAAYREDRRRDLAATLLGYRVVRLTWEEVELHWERTSRILTEMVRRGIHRGPRRRKGRTSSRRG